MNVKVENKSRKQTVKVKTAPTTDANGPQNTVPLLKRIDDLEKQVSKLNSLTIKFARNSVVDRFERSKLEQEIDDNRRANLKLIWGLWVVAIIIGVLGCIL